MEILQPNEREFDQLIQTNGVVLVDFWATWCVPCQMMAPIIAAIAEKYAGKISVAKVDIDQQVQLAERYNIMSIPTVIVFSNGKPVQQEVGVRSQAVYEQMISDLL